LSFFNVTKSTVEAEIVNGNGYNISFVDTAVADAANSDIRFLTHATRPVVLFATIFGEGNADISIFEAATISAGNALTKYNLDRNSVNTSGSTVTEGPTVSATGSTEILDVFIPSTIKKDAVPFSAATAFPRILKVNTEYLIRYTNNSGSTATISWVLQWVELP